MDTSQERCLVPDGAVYLGKERMKLKAENSSNENKLSKMTSIFLNMRFHFKQLTKIYKE
jgi:hypothetical protein